MNALLITRADELRRAAATWKQAEILAVDTEFVFERTYYPRLGLVQLATAGEIWLVDPVACGDLSALGDALTGPGLKALHSATGDLAVLFRALGTLPHPIVDTQVAAAFAGLGSGISYQRLVEAVIGKLLAKGETRSDWLARPLSPEQLAYAAEDVVDLEEVVLHLRERLSPLGRWDWVLADSARLLETARPLPVESAPDRLRGLDRLPPADRTAAQALAIWRERDAIARDLPRRWVLDDAALYLLARYRPANREELEGIAGLEQRAVKRDGEAWLSILAEAARSPLEPRLPARGRPSPRERHLADRLHRLVRRRAEELALPPELLASRRLVEELAADALAGRLELRRELAGWRRGVLGDELLAAARSTVE